MFPSDNLITEEHSYMEHHTLFSPDRPSLNTRIPIEYTSKSERTDYVMKSPLYSSNVRQEYGAQHQLSSSPLYGQWHHHGEGHRGNPLRQSMPATAKSCQHFLFSDNRKPTLDPQLAGGRKEQNANIWCKNCEKHSDFLMIVSPSIHAGWPHALWEQGLREE